MKTIVDYIEELKEKYQLKSYYKSMAYIGMNTQGWTKIKAGGGISEKKCNTISTSIKD